MVNRLLAHAGETHETATEAAVHAANSGLVIQTATVFWLFLLLVPPILLLVLHVLNVKLTTRLLLISLFLIIFSIVSYQEPGLYSVIALTVGFGIVLLQTILGLSSSE